MNKHNCTDRVTRSTSKFTQLNRSVNQKVEMCAIYRYNDNCLSENLKKKKIEHLQTPVTRLELIFVYHRIYIYIYTYICIRVCVCVCVCVWVCGHKNECKY